MKLYKLLWMGHFRNHIQVSPYGHPKQGTDYHPWAQLCKNKETLYNNIHNDTMVKESPWNSFYSQTVTVLWKIPFILSIAIYFKYYGLQLNTINYQNIDQNRIQEHYIRN